MVLCKPLRRDRLSHVGVPDPLLGRAAVPSGPMPPEIPLVCAIGSTAQEAGLWEGDAPSGVKGQRQAVWWVLLNSLSSTCQIMCWPHHNVDKA